MIGAGGTIGATLEMYFVGIHKMKILVYVHRLTQEWLMTHCGFYVMLVYYNPCVAHSDERTDGVGMIGFGGRDGATWGVQFVGIQMTGVGKRVYTLNAVGVM